MYKIPANTLFLGKNIVFVPECNSTNDLASHLSKKQGTLEGTIVITAHQTAGRGQRGNSWEAEPNMNLTFSLIIKPYFLSTGDHFYLNIFTSLGIIDTITEIVGKKVHIKWPNDILIEEKKICGILIENQLQGNQVITSVVGVGINVNQTQFNVKHASSLRIVSGQLYELQLILNTLLEKLEARYLQMRDGKFPGLLHDYHQNLYGYNKINSFMSNGERFEGKVTGVDHIGRLGVQTSDGIKFYNFKEISLVYS